VFSIKAFEFRGKCICNRSEKDNEAVRSGSGLERKDFIRRPSRLSTSPKPTDRNIVDRLQETGSLYVA